MGRPHAIEELGEVVVELRGDIRVLLESLNNVSSSLVVQHVGKHLLVERLAVLGILVVVVVLLVQLEDTPHLECVTRKKKLSLRIELQTNKHGL